MSLARRILPPLALMLVALPAAADAPIGQYEPFDGRSVTIIDRKTGLEWARATLQTNKTYGDAVSFCSVGAFVGGGAGRVPTIKELLSILDEDPHKEFDGTSASGFRYVYLDSLAFEGTPTNQRFWSSTPNASSDQWTLDFGTGAMNSLPTTSSAALRCVRP